MSKHIKLAVIPCPVDIYSRSKPNVFFVRTTREKLFEDIKLFLNGNSKELYKFVTCPCNKNLTAYVNSKGLYSDFQINDYGSLIINLIGFDTSKSEIAGILAGPIVIVGKNFTSLRKRDMCFLLRTFKSFNETLYQGLSSRSHIYDNNK